MDNTNKASAIILGAAISGGLILSSVVGAYAFIKAKTYEDSFSVTGSAKIEVKADKAKWNSSFSRTVKESAIKSGYVQMAKDLEIVKKNLITQGFTQDQMDISPVMMDQVYDYKSDSVNKEKEYILRQNIEIVSDDVVKVEKASKEIQEIVDNGVIYTVGMIEYYYSKLSELRVSLLSDAIKDAKARVEQIAKAGGRTVGPLKSASSGVVQVLRANSIDISDYGNYDTSSINKEVMVTVRAAFSIR